MAGRARSPTARLNGQVVTRAGWRRRQELLAAWVAAFGSVTGLAVLTRCGCPGARRPSSGEQGDHRRPEAKRCDAALEAYDQAVTGYADDPAPAVSEQVAKALYNQALTLAG